jgi:hypothetical protein
MAPSSSVPGCNVPLKEARTSYGRFWACKNFGRRALSVGLLRHTFIPESINPLWLVNRCFLKLHREGYRAPEIGDVVIEDALIRLARCQGTNGAHREIFIHAIVCG